MAAPLLPHPAFDAYHLQCLERVLRRPERKRIGSDLRGLLHRDIIGRAGIQPRRVVIQGQPERRGV